MVYKYKNKAAEEEGRPGSTWCGDGEQGREGGEVEGRRGRGAEANGRETEVRRKRGRVGLGWGHLGFFMTRHRCQFWGSVFSNVTADQFFGFRGVGVRNRNGKANKFFLGLGADRAKSGVGPEERGDGRRSGEGKRVGHEEQGREDAERSRGFGEAVRFNVCWVVCGGSGEAGELVCVEGCVGRTDWRQRGDVVL